MTTTKICIDCKKEKPTDDFHQSASYTGGIASRCKLCRRAINRDYKRRAKLGQVQRRPQGKKASQVHIEPFDPELEGRRHVQNLIAQFGEEGAKAKIKLEAFAT